tara:strand:+ start:2440 stop:4980 length:2541 start_codon:yes stop_codon:yes gene_type:complete
MMALCELPSLFLGEQLLSLKPFSLVLLKILLPSLLFIFVIFYVDYRSSVESKWQALIKQQVSAVEAGRHAIAEDIKHIVGDIKILSSSFQVFEYIDFDVKNTLKNQFVFFSQNKARYEQIRYLDNSGMEIIRVDRGDNNISESINDQSLQDKSKRYYFNQASSLAKNSVYISSIDWNMENGEVELPFRPTLRFAMPVFDKFARRQGVIVINYSASHLISRFVDASSLYQQQLFLVNNSGQLLYLKEENVGAKWILGQVKRMKELHPNLWKEIKTSLQGQIKVDNGYYTFTSMKPMSLVNIKSRKDWILISQLLPAELSAIKKAFIESRIPLYFLVSSLCVLLAIIFTRIKIYQQEILQTSKYEQRFRQILEGLNLAAVIIDPKGRLIYANQNFLTQTGYASEAIIDQDWLLSIMVKGRTREKERLARLIENPTKVKQIEFLILNHQGDSRAYRWSSSFFIDAIEHKKYLTLIGSDITKQRELELERSKLFQAVEQAPVTVMITNVKGVITYVNPNFTKVTGYNSVEVLGETPAFLQSRTIYQTNTQALWQRITQGNTWHGEFCNRKKNGQDYWEVASISPVKNNIGNIVAYVAVKRDITKERLLSLKLADENKDKIKHEHDAVVGRMAYMIAHDLRNPLSSVKMTMQMLPNQIVNISEDVAELTEISLEQIYYMENILTSLLAYARPDKNKYEWLALTHIIDLVIANEKKVKTFQRVKFSYNSESNLPLIHADKTKMQQVFQNLIVNAVQASMSDKNSTSQVDITVNKVIMQSGEKILINIINNGDSVDPADVEKLFEPFYTTKAKGTGLGLAIVKNIINYYHGDITLKPLDNGGTCCTVMLPLTR